MTITVFSGAGRYGILPRMKKISSVVLAALVAVPAGALEWQSMGARALGMGGAGVALAQGPLASYWNPAALGRATENSYGVAVPFGVHAGLTGTVLEGAKNLQDLKDSCASGGACTAAQIQDALNKLNDPNNGLRVDANAGANLKIGKIGLFANGFVDMGAIPVVDLAHTSNADLATQANTSKLIVKGARVLEFGAGYGHELPFAPGVYLGGNLKLMNAQVGYANYFILQNTNDSSNILSKLKDGARTSSNFGVDAGALWDVRRTFEDAPLRPKFGLVGRNLNNPKFNLPDAAIANGFTGRFSVNPQMRLGAALTPLHWWNIAADLDLTRNLTPVDNVASRQFGLGTEVNVFNRPWINIPVRFGISRNLERSDSGTMLSAGAGLNFLHFMIDASGSLSPKRIQTQSQGKSTKIPRELAGAVQLSLLFGGSDGEAPRADEQLAPTRSIPVDGVRQDADKAQKDLDREAAKPANP